MVLASNTQTRESGVAAFSLPQPRVDGCTAHMHTHMRTHARTHAPAASLSPSCSLPVILSLAYKLCLANLPATSTCNFDKVIFHATASSCARMAGITERSKVSRPRKCRSDSFAADGSDNDGRVVWWWKKLALLVSRRLMAAGRGGREDDATRHDTQEKRRTRRRRRPVGNVSVALPSR